MQLLQSTICFDCTTCQGISPQEHASALQQMYLIHSSHFCNNEWVESQAQRQSRYPRHEKDSLCKLSSAQGLRWMARRGVGGGAPGEGAAGEMRGDVTSAPISHTLAKTPLSPEVLAFNSVKSRLAEKHATSMNWPDFFFPPCRSIWNIVPHYSCC